MTKKDNVIATMLQVLGGIIIVVNAFRALTLTDDFNGGLAFDVFLQGLIYGTLLIGFGEVIRLMQGIFNQREPFRPVEESESERRAALARAGETTVSLETRNRIIDYYAKQNIVADDVEITPYDGYYIVHHGSERDIVDLNNWEVEIVTENQLRSEPKLRALLE